MAKNKKKSPAKKVAKAKPVFKKAAKPSKMKATKSAKPIKKVTQPVKKTVTPKKASSRQVSAPKSTSQRIHMTRPPSLKWSEFVTPLDDRLIVHLTKGEKMTAGGLYIPDTVSSSNDHLKGNVVAVGRGHRDTKGRIRPMDVQVGHQVLFSEYAGSKVNWNGQEVIILRENDVLGIVD